MIKLYYCLLFFLILSSCKEKVKSESKDNIQCDIRLGTKFYSILFNEKGNAYVIKGTGSFYTDSFKIVSFDTCSTFKIDSVEIFFKELNKIKANPIFRANRTGTASRAEVYYDRQKVYDGYAWDETYWDLFRPIMEQIPKGCNPFRVDDKPFE